MPITVDDVTEFVAVSDRLQDCLDDLDDLIERMRSKRDIDRVSSLRIAKAKLLDGKRMVENAL